MSRHLRQAIERSSVPISVRATGPSQIGADIAGRLSSYGGLVNTSGETTGSIGAAELYTHFREWVYVAGNAIARRLSAAELTIGRMTGGKSGKRAPNWLVKQAQNQNVDVIESHPAHTLFQDCNSVQSRQEFLLTSVVNLVVTGWLHWLHGEGDDGHEIWSVPTSWMSPNHDGGLFTSFDLRVSGQAGSRPLTADQVTWRYLPDPANPKCAWSPLQAILGSSTIDGHMQTTREQIFEDGTYPNIAIRVGEETDPVTGQSSPAALDGAQRTQVVRAIRQIWDRTVGRGEPAILDAIITDIFKLGLEPTSLGFEMSEPAIKARIFQAFGVNPIVVGEIQGANRAAAVVADQSFCDNAVNPIGSLLSGAYTEAIRKVFNDDSLCCWLDIVRPEDPDLRLREWQEGLKVGAVDRHEYRQHVLAMPESEAPAEPMAHQPAGVQSLLQVVTAVSQGVMTADAAQVLMVTCWGLSEEVASKIASGIVQADPVAMMAQLRSVKTVNEGVELFRPYLAARHLIQLAHVVTTKSVEEDAANSLAGYFPGPVEVRGEAGEVDSDFADG